MFQSFEVMTRPDQGPSRLAALRAEIRDAGLDGFLVPRADAHQGEYVSARDERLSWLTGFTGSAGFCAVLPEIAGVFVDGRYRTQVKQQVALDVFSPVPWPDVGLAEWVKSHMPGGGRMGFDPWLHTVEQLERLQSALAGTGIDMVRCDNLVDRIWPDQPASAAEPVTAHPIQFAGEAHADKRARLAAELTAAGHVAAVITLPDSLCWLLNIRGADIPRNPVAQGFAVLHADATVDLFMDQAKLQAVGDHLGDAVRGHAPGAFLDHLSGLEGPVRIDPGSCPVRVADCLEARAVHGDEPCLRPKAIKNAAEIAGSAEAHLRDGAAVVTLLAWLDGHPPGALRETQVVTHLEMLRKADNALRDISFETIAGSGPNGAVIHYRVSEETDREMQAGDLLVLDSGGQYLDGTTDITRTIAIGAPARAAQEAFTRVLTGMAAMSRLRWPKGLAGRDIEAIGRVPLWLAHQDFDHGLGHGVGAYLSVHEGPQRLSRVSTVPLEPGMILSNEPGYYREGAFGIRLENLLVVEEAPLPEGGDAHRDMLCWRTLTFVPIDRRLIVPEMLDPATRDWLNGYHRDVLACIGPRIGSDVLSWLEAACAPV